MNFGIIVMRNSLQLYSNHLQKIKAIGRRRHLRGAHMAADALSIPNDGITESHERESV